GTGPPVVELDDLPEVVPPGEDLDGSAQLARGQRLRCNVVLVGIAAEPVAQAAVERGSKGVEGGEQVAAITRRLQRGRDHSTSEAALAIGGGNRYRSEAHGRELGFRHVMDDAVELAGRDQATGVLPHPQDLGAVSVDRLPIPRHPPVVVSPHPGKAVPGQSDDLIELFRAGKAEMDGQRAASKGGDGLVPASGCSTAGVTEA